MKYSVIIFIMALDILTLPLSPLYSLPYSALILLFLVLLKKIEIKNRIKFSLFTFAFSVFLSTCFSSVFKAKFALMDNGYMKFVQINIYNEDVKRCIYIFLSIIIYVFFSSELKKHAQLKKYIDKAVIITCIFYILLSFIHLVNIDIFYQIKSIFYSVDVNMSQNQELILSGYLQRYSFIFLDPNNAGYFYLILAFYLIENVAKKTITKTILYISIGYSIIIVMSNGGLICAIVVIILNLTTYSLHKKRILKIKVSNLIISIFSVIIFIIIAILNKNLLNNFNNLFTLALERWKSNTSVSRIDIYKSLLHYQLPNLIGNGYSIVINGQFFKPHSDHFRFMYSYGIVGYISFMIFILSNKIFHKRYTFLVPAFFAFSINSILDEPRLIYTIMLLLATISSTSKYD